MDTREHLDALREEGVGLAAAVSAAGPAARVPGCPGWTVEQLVRHVGYVHRWAAGVVSAGGSTPPAKDDDDDDVSCAGPPDPAQVIDWYRSGHAGLVAVLERVPADHECWCFLPAPSGRAFWARRQAHETAVHRADAEAAGGRRHRVAPAFADDGIDELLVGFGVRSAPRWRDDTDIHLAVTSTDTGGQWTVRSGPGGGAVYAGPGEAGTGAAGRTCSLAGPAPELYLFLWNRRDRDGLSVAGDSGVLDWWAARSRIRWS